MLIMGPDSDLSGWKNPKKENYCLWQSAEELLSIVWWYGTKTKFTLFHLCHLLFKGVT